MKLFIAMRWERSFRDGGEYSRVSARKIGLPPRGCTMGKSALRKRRVVFAASSKAASRFGSIAEQGPRASRPRVEIGGDPWARKGPRQQTSAALRGDDLGCGQRLAHVALGVLGNMNE